MHPLSTALFLVGYGLALPIGARWRYVTQTGNRLALWGHQAGVFLALAGWVTKRGLVIAGVHVVWLIAASMWFSYAAPTSKPDGPQPQSP